MNAVSNHVVTEELVSTRQGLTTATVHLASLGKTVGQVILPYMKKTADQVVFMIIKWKNNNII